MCELCERDGGEIVFRAALFRVVLVDESHYPGFCRLILNAHVAEMTDLPQAERDQLMRALWQVESAVREVMVPHKVNLASFGNMVPHVHWHVIPRYRDDVHFPQPTWGSPQRSADASSLAARREKLPALRARLQSLTLP